MLKAVKVAVRVLPIKERDVMALKSYECEHLLSAYGNLCKLKEYLENPVPKRIDL